MAREKSITIRLGTKDGDKVLAALRATGTEGERMANRLERSGQKGDRGLRAVSRAAQDVRSNVDGLAGRVPVLGNALTALGPAGLVAAAGIGAIVLGLRAGLRIAREAVAAFDEIGKSADRLALSTDTFQALQQAAAEESVPWERAAQALQRYTLVASQAATGRGELYSMLRAQNPELLRQIQLAETNEERLRLMTDALRNARSETERNALAQAAFGESGLAVAQMLARQQGGIDGMIASARNLGVVVDEHLIRNSERMATEMETASRIMDLNMKQAFIDLAPILVSSAQLFANIAREVRRVVDRFRELEDMSTTGLQERAEELRANLVIAGISGREGLAAERGRPDNSLLNRALGINTRERALDTAEGWLDELDAIEARLAERSALSPGSGDDDGDGSTLVDPAALAARNQLEQQAAQIRGQLGQNTALIAVQERQLNTLVEARLLTRDEAAKSLQRFTESLDGTAEAERRALAIAEQLRSPLEIYRANLEELNRLRAQGALDEATHTRAVEAARRVYEAADPVLSRAAEIREQMLTVEQQLAREQALVNEAVEAGALSASTAAAYLRQFEASLRDSGEASRWLRLEQEILNGALNGTITSFEDLGRVALRVLYEIAREMITTADTAQSFGGFVSDIIGALAGGLFGGAGTMRVASRHTLANTASTAGLTIPTRHTGGDAVATPDLARRLGMELAPNEGLHILRKGEPVLSHSNTGELMGLARAALSGAGQAGVVVNVHNHAGVEIERRESREAGGRRRLDLILRDQTRTDMASGEFDEALMGRLSGARKPVAIR